MHQVPRARPDHDADPDPPGGALLDGRHRDRHQRPDPHAERIWAAGEAACVSLHGANRLGSNSTAECLVWGGITGEEIVKALPKLGRARRCPRPRSKAAKAHIDALLARDGTREPLRAAPRAARDHGHQRRRLPHRRGARRGARDGARAARALAARPGRRQGHGLQLEPVPRARAREPARPRRGHGGGRAGAPGVARRARPPRLRRPATTRSGSSTRSRGRPTARRGSTTSRSRSTRGSRWNESTRGPGRDQERQTCWRTRDIRIGWASGAGWAAGAGGASATSTPCTG